MAEGGVPVTQGRETVTRTSSTYQGLPPVVEPVPSRKRNWKLVSGVRKEVDYNLTESRIGTDVIDPCGARAEGIAFEAVERAVIAAGDEVGADVVPGSAAIG